MTLATPQAPPDATAQPGERRPLHSTGTHHTGGVPRGRHVAGAGAAERRGRGQRRRLPPLPGAHLMVQSCTHHVRSWSPFRQPTVHPAPASLLSAVSCQSSTERLDPPICCRLFRCRVAAWRTAPRKAGCGCCAPSASTRSRSLNPRRPAAPAARNRRRRRRRRAAAPAAPASLTTPRRRAQVRRRKRAACRGIWERRVAGWRRRWRSCRWRSEGDTCSETVAATSVAAGWTAGAESGVDVADRCCPTGDRVLGFFRLPGL